MVKSCITISLVPSLSKGPWVYCVSRHPVEAEPLWGELEVSISKAKAAGFDAVELFTASADAVEPDRLARLLDEHDMKLAALGTGAGKVLHGLELASPDKQIRDSAREFISRMIEFGAAFGAPAIIGSMQGLLPTASPGQGRARLADEMARLAAKAAQCGSSVILEPLNRYETSLVNTLAQGAELIRDINCENIFLLADLFHMNIEEASIPQGIRESGSYIGYVHFVDSNRRPAGMGHIDLAEAAEALREIGFDGYVSAEALPWPDSDKAASQTMAAFRKYFR